MPEMVAAPLPDPRGSDLPGPDPRAIDAARRGENFPVASRLVSRRLRPAILAFYAFARTGDMLADDPDRDRDSRISALHALAGRWGALALRHGIDPAHGHDLLAAFRWDAGLRQISDGRSLMGYCRLSAMPCARVLMDLHGEHGQKARAAADALAAALQLINHGQDLRDDARNLSRVYLPASWCREAGADPAVLKSEIADPALARVLKRLHDRIEDLLAQAAALPMLCRSPRLALESAVVLAFARRLALRLGRDDALIRPPRLGRLERGWLALCAVLAIAFRRAFAPSRNPADPAGGRKASLAGGG